MLIESPAAKSFGKVKDAFWSELHAEILSHAKQVENGHVPQLMEGITVHDTDVLEPEPQGPGGLMSRPDAVSSDSIFTYLSLSKSKCSVTISEHQSNLWSHRHPEPQFSV